MGAECPRTEFEYKDRNAHLASGLEVAFSPPHGRDRDLDADDDHGEQESDEYEHDDGGNPIEVDADAIVEVGIGQLEPPGLPVRDDSLDDGGGTSEAGGPLCDPLTMHRRDEGGLDLLELGGIDLCGPQKNPEEFIAGMARRRVFGRLVELDVGRIPQVESMEGA